MSISIQQLIAVSAGGAFGAASRYLLMIAIGHWIGHGFPWGTLMINVIGSFALGAFVEISALVWSPSPEVRAFLVVGLLGAFTTFSTFSLDAYALWARGEGMAAFSYVALSFVFGIGAFVAGLSAIRTILT